MTERTQSEKTIFLVALVGALVGLLAILLPVEAKPVLLGRSFAGGSCGSPVIALVTKQDAGGLVDMDAACNQAAGSRIFAGAVIIMLAAAGAFVGSRIVRPGRRSEP